MALRLLLDYSRLPSLFLSTTPVTAMPSPSMISSGTCSPVKGRPPDAFCTVPAAGPFPPPVFLVPATLLVVVLPPEVVVASVPPVLVVPAVELVVDVVQSVTVLVVPGMVEMMVEPGTVVTSVLPG